MSTHPNAILMAVLTPDGLSKKTMRNILGEYKIDSDIPSSSLNIGDLSYYSLIMESSYDEARQIAAREGDLVFFGFITYGYGDTISWTRLSSLVNDLTSWAEGVCSKHNCSYEIKITANYW